LLLLLVTAIQGITPDLGNLVSTKAFRFLESFLSDQDRGESKDSLPDSAEDVDMPGECTIRSGKYQALDSQFAPKCSSRIVPSASSPIHLSGRQPVPSPMAADKLNWLCRFMC
jgi:hypothetical protein